MTSEMPCDHECGIEQTHELCHCVKCGATYPNAESRDWWDKVNLDPEVIKERSSELKK